MLGLFSLPPILPRRFAILRGGDTRVKEKFETILGGESALNDVFAILLVSVIFIPLVSSELDENQVNFDMVQILFIIIWGIYRRSAYRGNNRNFCR